jgi:hypothetical protein
MSFLEPFEDPGERTNGHSTDCKPFFEEKES